MTGKRKNNKWIIDTGTSSYILESVEVLCDLREVIGCLVGLPNGKHVIAIKDGSLNHDRSLRLENVFFVPNLKCNLISMSQLIDESNYIVQFTNDLCVIQATLCGC